MFETDAPIKTDIRSEALAYWYFRLNGFVSIVNFVVRTENRDRGTGVDLLGIRFPYRAELLQDPEQDDRPFRRVTDRPYIVLAEVKRRPCDLDGPWARPGQRRVPRALRAAGALPLEDVEEAAECLSQEGAFETPGYYLSLFCVGEETNPQVSQQYPLVPQHTWQDLLTFVYRRFSHYPWPEAGHSQWEEDGHSLWLCALFSEDRDEFCSLVRVTP